MKLSDIKKNADAKAAEVESARKHAELIAELDVHPLLKSGCDRNVREAYFCGICFAAVSDEDNVVDRNERRVICRVGQSLSLLSEEIDELIAGVSKTVQDAIVAVNPETGEGGDRIFALLEECANSLKDQKVFRLFVAEYVKVCATKSFGDQDTKDMMTILREHVVPKCGLQVVQTNSDAIEEWAYEALCRVAQSGRGFHREDLLKLTDWLGEDEVRYLMLDVLDDDVKPMLNRCRMDGCRIMFVNLLNVRKWMLVNRAALPVILAKIVEGDDTWPVEFRRADYQRYFDAAGMVEAEARSFVAQNLLPNMKSSFERAMERLDDVPRCHEDISGCMRNGVKLDSCREFRVLFRYAVFMNAFLDIDKQSVWYGFAGQSDALWEYCTCSTKLDRLEMDDWSMSQRELDGYLRRWESIFKIIESMGRKDG